MDKSPGPPYIDFAGQKGVAQPNNSVILFSNVFNDLCYSWISGQWYNSESFCHCGYKHEPY